MRKLKQRRFGGPDNTITEQGDCWATAVCIYAGFGESERNELHRRIVLSDIALLRSGRNPQKEPNWWYITQRFLNERGLNTLTVVAPEEVQPESLYITSGPAPRGLTHSMVSYGNGELWSDPHPSDDGLVEITEWICWWNGEVL